MNDMTTYNDIITTSYGVIVFYIDDKQQIWYLLCQRRDTIEYADFLRGRYTNSLLEIYFTLMTTEERDRLKNYDFDELWNDLWINHENQFFREVKSRAKLKYQTNLDLMKKYLETTTSFKKEPSWGIPKGKKNFKETEIQCAFREFIEETKLQIEYNNLLNLAPSTEIFKGSNGKIYRTVYYIARVDEKLPINKIKTNGIRKETVSDEVSNLKWCSLNEALLLLPTWTQKILIETEIKIRKYLDY
jgi:8-oxo-dGTP pyrophosphatase MutT (NUDIX family)